MGSLLLLLNNLFETKFKGRDKTQSTPQKNQNKNKNKSSEKKSLETARLLTGSSEDF